MSVLRFFLGDLCDICDWHYPWNVNTREVVSFGSFLHWAHTARFGRNDTLKALALRASDRLVRFVIRKQAARVVRVGRHQALLMASSSHRQLSVVSLEPEVILLCIVICIERSCCWTGGLQVWRPSCVWDRFESWSSCVLVLNVPLVAITLRYVLRGGWPPWRTKVQALVIHPLLLFAREWEIRFATLRSSFQFPSSFEAEFALGCLLVRKIYRILLHFKLF